MDDYNNIFNIYISIKLHILYKKASKFLILDFIYEIFMNFNFLYKKNIYVCVIDYNFFWMIKLNFY